MTKISVLLWMSFLFLPVFALASPIEQAPMAVWVNEAIVASNSYRHDHFLADQKQIAHYFSADGWINYTKALNAIKLPEIIRKNAYNVSAVATQPPVITLLQPNHWQATMTILVRYQNPQFQQQQNLKVILGFTTAPPGEGVRGYKITSLRSVEIAPPCQCTEPPTKLEPST